MLHLECVTPQLLDVLKQLHSIPELDTFRLVGGTAIALQIGHRKSIDIDFFSNSRVDKRILRESLQKKFNVEVFSSEHSLSAEIQGVRVELFDDWMLPFLEPYKLIDGLRIASLKDLVAFKISAITGRREKKDYIDLFFLFKKFGPLNVLKDFKNYDPLLSSKSILFALGEVSSAKNNRSQFPELTLPLNWDEVERSMIDAAKRMSESLRGNRPGVT